MHARNLIERLLIESPQWTCGEPPRLTDKPWTYSLYFQQKKITVTLDSIPGLYSRTGEEIPYTDWGRVSDLLDDTAQVIPVKDKSTTLQIMRALRDKTIPPLPTLGALSQRFPIFVSVLSTDLGEIPIIGDKLMMFHEKNVAKLPHFSFSKLDWSPPSKMVRSLNAIITAAENLNLDYMVDDTERIGDTEEIGDPLFPTEATLIALVNQRKREDQVIRSYHDDDHHAWILGTPEQHDRLMRMCIRGELSR